MISVVIPTMGRASVVAAVESVLREGMQPIVVSDGFPTIYDDTPDPRVRYVRLGRNYGKTPTQIFYGQIAITVGYYLSSTEFTAGLGDDDELCVGAGEHYAAVLREDPKVDIWIPELQYADGGRACGMPGNLVVGNVSHPMYRTAIYAEIPMYHERGANHGIHDFLHVQRCVEAGWRVGWMQRPCVLIRPQLPGRNGAGE